MIDPFAFLRGRQERGLDKVCVPKLVPGELIERG
jgi:hypothetical protein